MDIKIYIYFLQIEYYNCINHNKTMSNSTLFLNSITYEKWILNLLLVELKFIIYNNDNVLIFIN